MTNNVDNADKTAICKDYKIENDIPYCMRLGCRIECEGKPPCQPKIADKNELCKDYKVENDILPSPPEGGGIGGR